MWRADSKHEGFPDRLVDGDVQVAYAPARQGLALFTVEAKSQLRETQGDVPLCLCCVMFAPLAKRRLAGPDRGEDAGRGELCSSAPGSQTKCLSLGRERLSA